MATNAQVQSFIAKWSAAANQAGQQLGIPPAYILGQWGMETGWGTQPNMGQNNPGNVGNLGGSWQNYGSQQAFVNEYVASVKSDFPYFQHPVSSGVPTVAQVFGGHQSYDPSNPNYNVNVQNGINAMVNQGGTLGQSVARGWEKSVTSSLASEGAVSGLPTPANALGWKISGPSWIGPIVWLVVSMSLVVLGVILLLKASPTGVAKNALKVVTPEATAANKRANAA